MTIKHKHNKDDSPGVEEIIVGGYTYNAEFVSFERIKSFSLIFFTKKTNNRIQIAHASLQGCVKVLLYYLHTNMHILHVEVALLFYVTILRYSHAVCRLHV